MTTSAAEHSSKKYLQIQTFTVPLKEALGLGKQQHKLKVLQVLEDGGLAADRLDQRYEHTLVTNLKFFCV